MSIEFGFGRAVLLFCFLLSFLNISRVLTWLDYLFFVSFLILTASTLACQVLLVPNTYLLVLYPQIYYTAIYIFF